MDPADDRQRERDGLTIGQVCDWYLTEAEAGRLLGRKRTPIKVSTLAMDRSRIESHIRPLIGRRKVAAIRLRSEEHTSELQSLMRISYAVFCLKKKTKQTETTCHRTLYNKKHSNKNTNNT